MGKVIDLKPITESLEFIQDLARFHEAILGETAIRKKYRLAEDDWEKLGNDDELIRKVEAESVRRVRDGSHKREKAQALIVKGPAVLDAIMSDSSASPKHRIDSIKALDSLAGGGPEGDGATATDRFIITINLSSDGVDQVLHFDKNIKPDGVVEHRYSDDDEPPQDEWLPVIAANGRKDDRGGEPL
jgi:hypothetical protein